jgi:LacI family transcriptional regulator
VVSGLVALGLPVTVLSSSTDVAGVPFIAIDNRTGIRLSLNHLRDLGHTRIAFAGLGRERVSMRERHDAYLEWMTEQGLPLVDGYMVNDFHAGDSA